MKQRGVFKWTLSPNFCLSHANRLSDRKNYGTVRMRWFQLIFHCEIWVCIVNNLVRPASWKWSSFDIRSWSVAPSTHCLILRLRAFKQGCLMRKLNICWKNCWMIMKEGSRLNIYLFELSFSDEVWMSRSVWRHVQMLRIWTLSLLINIERLFVY